MLEILLSVIAVLTSLGSLWFTDKQWQKIKGKIAMVTDVDKAVEVLPTWYTERMMTDYWSFGLLTSEGIVIAISNVNAISNDGKWIDVELLTKAEIPSGANDNKFVTAISDDRRKASVQIDKIVLAYELVTS